MRDSSRVTAEMMFDMISPTCLMIVCRLHRAARPRSRRCLHGCISKQRASARIAARGGAKRVPCAAVQCFGRGNVSGVKRAAAGRAGGAPGVARNGWNDGGACLRPVIDSGREIGLLCPELFRL
ncbi:hypothetical protein [Burkholderia ubonensis]|uniref:hypothetical protein n=1 Tax=Burkholderia ubonensis TaxID=101571 RepID=UPI0012F8FAF5|nr:hypothetical protein [Burkholderia ubonensis]